jgi:hypothetical protein
METTFKCRTHSGTWMSHPLPFCGPIHHLALLQTIFQVTARPMADLEGGPRPTLGFHKTPGLSTVAYTVPMPQCITTRFLSLVVHPDRTL